MNTILVNASLLRIVSVVSIVEDLLTIFSCDLVRPSDMLGLDLGRLVSDLDKLVLDLGRLVSDPDKLVLDLGRQVLDLDISRCNLDRLLLDLDLESPKAEWLRLAPAMCSHVCGIARLGSDLARLR